jgi:tyrosine-protein kinase
VNVLQSQINALDTQVQNAPPSQRDEVEQSVSQRRNSLLDQQSGFRETLDQLQVRIALTSGGASVVTPAARPKTPVEPRPLRTGGLGLALGLVVGIGLAFLFENLDDRVRTKADFERATDDLPVLGLIPSFERDQLPITLAQPRSAAAEAYRTLRTSVQFLSIDSPKRLIQVTSPKPSEGKTTTTANLGLALAYAGVRVCIVDCDLRRPCLADAFRVDPTIGFTSVLLGTTSLDNALGASESWGPHLTILPAGPVPPNPSELLSSPRVQKLFELLTQMFDVVLVDTPPTLPVSDALVASRLVDAVLLVGNAGSTTRKEVQHALELLRNVGAPVVGTVLNGLGPGDKAQAGYGYGYGYGAADARREVTPPELLPGEPRASGRKRRRAHAKRDEVGAGR